MMIVKSPKVRSISGAEISFKMGLIKKIYKIEYEATVNRVAKLSPCKVKPSTIFAAI